MWSRENDEGGAPGAPPASWKCEMLVSGEWTGNGMRFATKHEALGWGNALLARWTMPDDMRALESAEPVNYRLDETGLHPVET